MVSKQRPKFNGLFVIPCWKIEFLRVLEMIKSAHCGKERGEEEDFSVNGHQPDVYGIIKMEIV